MNKKTVLVCGAGGFIGGHLVASFLKENKYNIVCADVKPVEYWFQSFNFLENFSLDLKEYENCLKVTKNANYVFNMACNMGGMGFIENNKAECMLSVLINTNLLRASLKHNINKFFFSSSACVYNSKKQSKNFIPGLKEEDAYPADPEDGYGWEKLFSERMCRHFTEDFDLNTRVARYHNVYGPIGTFDGGREKAPAALCRKIAYAKMNKLNSIDVWGDGEQTRSFLYIDDCVDAILKLFHSNFKDPINIGSEEKVSINQLIDIIENIANIKLKREYQLDKPKGVNGRSSNNDLIKKVLNWNYNYSLKDGIEKTYHWINQFYQNKNNNNFMKFTKK
jgi:nucleoside-diphosphate-sugar epimerase